MLNTPALQFNIATVEGNSERREVIDDVDFLEDIKSSQENQSGTFMDGFC